MWPALLLVGICAAFSWRTSTLSILTTGAAFLAADSSLHSIIPSGANIYAVSDSPSQKSVSAMIEAQSVSRVFADPSLPRHRRLHLDACRVRGAGAWLTASPSSPDLSHCSPAPSLSAPLGCAPFFLRPCLCRSGLVCVPPLPCCSVACFGSFWPFLDPVNVFCCEVLAPFPTGLVSNFFSFPRASSVFWSPISQQLSSFLGSSRASSLFLSASATRHCHGFSLWLGWTSSLKLDSDFSCSLQHETKDGWLRWI